MKWCHHNETGEVQYPALGVCFNEVLAVNEGKKGHCTRRGK